MAKTTKLRQQKDQARKERTRGALLNAAERVFAVRGYHATLVADIVSDAGVGQGTFYRHFDSKRALFEELFERLASGLFAGFEEPLRPLPRTLDEYREMSLRGATNATRVIDQHAAALRIVLRHGPAIDDAFAARIEDVYERLAQLARVYLDHAVRSGLIPARDTELIAHAVVGYATRILTLWLEGRLPGRDSEDVVAELVDFALIGFAGVWPPRGARP